MDFVRIIPAQHFAGTPAPAHRPYAFYADAYSLHGRTIAECYQLVKGIAMPPKAGYYQKEQRTPFVWDSFPSRDPEAPLAKISIDGGRIRYEDCPKEGLENTTFIVIGVTMNQAITELDLFPATWRALSYIVSDPERMGAQPLAWDLSVRAFASARIHALFRHAHTSNGQADMLAARSSKAALGLEDFSRLPDPEEELDYYHYLSVNSSLTDEIVELFGISHRCWHGCGYLGWSGFPMCRFFLLRNQLPATCKVLILSGRERFFYDPS